MKRLFSLLLVVVLALSLQGCFWNSRTNRDKVFENTPCNQVGTTWRSEDGKIQFTIFERTPTVDANGIKDVGVRRGVGTMETDEGCIDITFYTGLIGEVYINNSTDTILEKGVGDFKHKDQLTVTFNEKTTYLEEGAAITFYRVDE